MTTIKARTITITRIGERRYKVEDTQRATRFFRSVKAAERDAQEWSNSFISVRPGMGCAAVMHFVACKPSKAEAR